MTTIQSSGAVSSWTSALQTVSVKIQNPSASVPLQTEAPANAGQSKSASDTYGMSKELLQLIKRYDVRNISVGDLSQLAMLMGNDGHASQEAVATISSLQVDMGKSATFDAASYFQEEMDSVSRDQASGKMQFQPSAIQGYQGAQQLMQKLAAIHDALQKDDSIQAAPEDGLQQVIGSRKLDFWISERLQGVAGNHGQQDWNGISGALQKLGVRLSATTDNASVAQKLDSAWQDYQKWSAASVKPSIDVIA